MTRETRPAWPWADCRDQSAIAVRRGMPCRACRLLAETWQRGWPAGTCSCLRPEGRRLPSTRPEDREQGVGNLARVRVQRDEASWVFLLKQFPTKSQRGVKDLALPRLRRQPPLLPQRD